MATNRTSRPNIYTDDTPVALKDLIVQELIVNEYIRRLLADAGKDIPGQSLNEGEQVEVLELLTGVTMYSIADPVLFEMARIVNGRATLSGILITPAEYYVFDNGGSVRLVSTDTVRTLLLDDCSRRVFRPCAGGKSLMGALSKQLLLDHCLI